MAGSLHVSNFGGGIVIEGSADAQHTDEVAAADNVDIGTRGALVVTSAPTNYLVLNDAIPNPWSKLWAVLESSGFNFSKVLAIGEGNATGVIQYIFATFNREGEASPLAFTAGNFFPPAGAASFPVQANGVAVLGSEFAGVYWVRFGTAGGAVAGTDPVAVRMYFVNIGAREGQAPTSAPGMFAVVVTPPATALTAYEIMTFDALGTGQGGSLAVPVDYKNGEGFGFFGSFARQLHFRGIISYNNHMFGWGYDASDDRWSRISGITNANPGVVTTAAAHGYKTGDSVRIRGVNGMTQVNGQTYTIIVTGATTFSIGVNTGAYGAYVASATDWVMNGAGDGPNRVMFCNIGRPTRWGNDKGTLGTDRAFEDSDAIVLGDSGEIIRGAIVWGGKLIFGTNKGLHYIGGYGRDSFLTDGANPIMRSFNIVGPNAMIEGPDKCLYGVSDQGLWVLSELGGIPKPVFEKLRDRNLRSNGYWDLIWTDNTRADTYPGKTNQDLVWTAVDWDRMQVVVGIPWCSIANGYGYGTDTVVLKYDVRGGGFTRQKFTGVQYTAAGYFRAQAGQAAAKFLGTATAAQSQIQKYSQKVVSTDTPPLPSTALIKVGPYEPFGADGQGTVRKLYGVIAFEPALGTTSINGITNANPAVISCTGFHLLKTGDIVEIWGNNDTTLEIVGGPYAITVIDALSFSIPVNATAFGAYIAGGNPLRWGQPVVWSCVLRLDDLEPGWMGKTPTNTTAVAPPFYISASSASPLQPQEGDLWIDTSKLDANIGNATAGDIIPARPGYLLRQRYDNTPVLITGATKANPCVITAPGHGLVTGDRISIREVGGMVELNNTAGAGPYLKDYAVKFIDADHFSLVGIDSTAYTTYTSGGRVFRAWWLVPGMGGSGDRMSFPIPVAQAKGTRLTFQMSVTTMGRRWQLEGFGINPGDGESQ